MIPHLGARWKRRFFGGWLKLLMGSRAGSSFPCAEILNARIMKRSGRKTGGNSYFYLLIIRLILFFPFFSPFFSFFPRRRTVFDSSLPLTRRGAAGMEPVAPFLSSSTPGYFWSFPTVCTVLDPGSAEPPRGTVTKSPKSSFPAGEKKKKRKINGGKKRQKRKKIIKRKEMSSCSITILSREVKGGEQAAGGQAGITGKIGRSLRSLGLIGSINDIAISRNFLCEPWADMSVAALIQ